MVYHWGLLVPTAILLFSVVIVMAGILLGARYSLYMAAVIFISLAGLQFVQEMHHLKPDLTWMKSGSTMGDVVGFSGLFLVIALVSWLFNRQMEFSLRRARKAELALQKHNDELEVKVLERTRQLQNEQLERMQQMYRFAELGHVSTALFHDLANHVSTVSIDIESLQRGDKSEILNRIDGNIHYIDTIVRRVRSQLQGKFQIETFDLLDEIREVAKVSVYGQPVARVAVELDFPDKNRLAYRGDVLRFRQLIINLLSNAVQAYSDSAPRKPKRIVVRVREEAKHIVIEVTDFGKGIPPNQQAKIFDPFYTSKKQGIGIGLFIVKQVTEKDFGGSVELSSSPKGGTTFTVHLPLKA